MSMSAVHIWMVENMRNIPELACGCMGEECGIRHAADCRIQRRKNDICLQNNVSLSFFFTFLFVSDFIEAIDSMSILKLLIRCSSTYIWL